MAFLFVCLMLNCLVLHTAEPKVASEDSGWELRGRQPSGPKEKKGGKTETLLSQECQLINWSWDNISSFLQNAATQWSCDSAPFPEQGELADLIQEEAFLGRDIRDNSMNHMAGLSRGSQQYQKELGHVSFRANMPSQHTPLPNLQGKDKLQWPFHQTSAVCFLSEHTI